MDHELRMGLRPGRQVEQRCRSKSPSPPPLVFQDLLKQVGLVYNAPAAAPTRRIRTRKRKADDDRNKWRQRRHAPSLRCQRQLPLRELEMGVDGGSDSGSDSGSGSDSDRYAWIGPCT